MKVLFDRVMHFKRKINRLLGGSEIDKLRKRGVTIGENVHIFATYIDPLFPFLITIGDNVTLTDVKILAHDASTYKELGYTKFGKVTIGNDVFIGAKTVILPNVNIGNKVIIGAGSIVGKNIPDNTVAVGNPCHPICSYDEYMAKHRNAITNIGCINKKPGELTAEEIQFLREHHIGIGYIK